MNSRLGRQQLLIKRKIGHSILETGYCVHPKMVVPEEHPEQGPVWQWVMNHAEALYPSLGSNYYKPGEGGVRQLDAGTLNELHEIFEETGALKFFDQIESASAEKARELKLSFTEDEENAYWRFIQE